MWTGSARTNFVKVKDVEALKASLAVFGDSIKLDQHFKDKSFICLEGGDPDTGGFPSSIYAGGLPSSISDGDGETIDFSFEEFVVPHLAEGQVLVVLSCGADKLRYLSGDAEAYAWDGRTVSLRMDDIYKMAAEQLNVPIDDIGEASYEDLPRSHSTRVEVDRGG